MDFARTLGLLFWSFTIILLTCYFGEMVTTQFENFSSELEKCNWYTFPNDFQKMFVILLQNAQKPVIIYGFGNVFCMRDTVKKVKMHILNHVVAYDSWNFILSSDSESKFFLLYGIASDFLDGTWILINIRQFLCGSLAASPW